MASSASISSSAYPRVSALIQRLQKSTLVSQFSWLTRTTRAKVVQSEPSLLDHQEPSEAYLLQAILAVSLAVMTLAFMYKQHVDPRKLLHSFGVSVKKVARSVREVERKAFHVAGLLVPLIQMLLLRQGFTSADCTRICWTITAVGWCCDLARLRVPFVRRNWPLQKILREHEKTALTGGCYFSLGCTLSIAMSPPSVAMASILFLVLGDMTAAIMGVSFGGDALGKMKLGREGKKSLEGSLAMFCVCFLVGCTIFGPVRLREYPIFFGALAATLTELYEPFQLNDNLTIPVFSSIAMQWAFRRIKHC